MNEFVDLTAQPDWSNDSCVAFDLDPKAIFGANVKAPRVFIPRSQLRQSPSGKTYVSEWILQKKVEELTEKYNVSEFSVRLAFSLITGVNQMVEKGPDKPESVPADAILALFDAAAKRVKFPKVSFGEEGDMVKFSRSGQRAKIPGSVNVTDGRPYGENVWYGRIDRDGQFQPSRSCTPEVQEVIVNFNRNPARYAAEQGKETGNCVFCRQPLSDDRSLSVGYGPTCAKTYSLPWGE